MSECHVEGNDGENHVHRHTGIKLERDSSEFQSTDEKRRYIPTFVPRTFYLYLSNYSEQSSNSAIYRHEGFRYLTGSRKYLPGWRGRNVDDDPDKANLRAAQTRGHWRAAGGGSCPRVLGRVFTHDSRRTPPSALAFATQRAQATCTHLRRGSGGIHMSQHEKGHRRRTATCHVARNAIFTHGMRACPRRYRGAPG